MRYEDDRFMGFEEVSKEKAIETINNYETVAPTKYLYGVEFPSNLKFDSNGCGNLNDSSWGWYILTLDEWFEERS